MKFFNLILISSFLSLHWAYPDGVPNTLAPSHRLYALCSMLHSLPPRSLDPSISSLMRETPAAEVSTSSPSTSSQARLHSAKMGIPRGYGYGLCSPCLLVSEHSPHYISASPNPDTVSEYPPVILGSDAWLPTRYERIATYTMGVPSTFFHTVNL